MKIDTLVGQNIVIEDAVYVSSHGENDRRLKKIKNAELIPFIEKHWNNKVDNSASKVANLCSQELNLVITRDRVLGLIRRNPDIFAKKITTSKISKIDNVTLRYTGKKTDKLGLELVKAYIETDQSIDVGDGNLSKIEVIETSNSNR